MSTACFLLIYVKVLNSGVIVRYFQCATSIHYTLFCLFGTCIHQSNIIHDLIFAFIKSSYKSAMKGPAP